MRRTTCTRVAVAKNSETCIVILNKYTAQVLHCRRAMRRKQKRSIFTSWQHSFIIKITRVPIKIIKKTFFISIWLPYSWILRQKCDWRGPPRSILYSLFFFIASFPLVQCKCGGAFRIYIYLRCFGRRGGRCLTLDEAPVVGLAVTDMLAHDHSIFLRYFGFVPGHAVSSETMRPH